MRTVFRRTREAEAGQALVLTLVFMTALIGMAGLVIDVGSWYVKREQAQAAADFGALAAAAELPESQAEATAAGEKYVKENLDESTAEVVPGYDGDPSKAEVKARTRGQTYFLRLFGFDTVGISARAVAKKFSGAVPLAIFVYDSECAAFGFGANGDNMDIRGGVHSNGSFKINGNDNYVGGATAGGPNGCDPILNGNNIRIGEGDEVAVEEELQDWPAYFTQGEFDCTFRARKFEFNETPQTIPSGVYCADESFTANGNDQTGNITVLAPEIVVNGNNQKFTPFAKDVLFFATGTKEMHLNGNNYDWSGIIFHPRGRIKINGNQYSVLNGLIEGLHVEVNGNGFNMNGTGEETFDFIGLME